MGNAALEKRMKTKKRLLILTAALPAGIMSFVFFIPTFEVLCLAPFLAHALLFLLIFLVTIDPCIMWEYFTDYRIKEIAEQLTERELNARIGLSDVRKGRFLIKLIWQNDSITVFRKLCILQSLSLLPILIMDFALGNFYRITVLIVFVWLWIPVFYGIEPQPAKDTYRPSSENSMDYLFMIMSPYGRGILFDRAIWGREVCATNPLKIRIALEEELKKYESGEKERPVSLDKIINRETPPPYRVR